MPLNYLFFKIIPADAAPLFLMNYILQEAHPIIARYGDHKVGTIFPEYDIESPGRTIAFQGDQAVLDRILAQDYFKTMEEGGVLKHQFAETDPNEHPLVLFLRNQKITASTPRGQQRKIRRIIRRQIERGEISNAREYQPRTDQQQSESPDTFYHLFFSDSKSTGQNMPLCIQMIPVNISSEPTASHTFDHYGFSTLREHRASVPLFLPIF